MNENEAFRRVYNNLDEFIATRKKCNECCSGKCKSFHCPLCPVTRFKPAKECKIVSHMRVHWKTRIAVAEERFVVRCHLEHTETKSRRGHVHCPFCGKTIVRKGAARQHVDKCCHRSSNVKEVHNSDLEEHWRHHEFLRSPLIVYNRERRTHCFGSARFSKKIYEQIMETLMKELIYSYRNPRRPYTVGAVLKIRNLADCKLQKVFDNHKLTTTMTEFGKLQCEPCMHENVTKSASKWCTDCEEGFCEDCCRSHKAQKMSRNHNVISTEDYKKMKKFNVNLDCPEHSKQLDFYCPTHDSVICVVCIQSKHGGCEDLRKINEAAKDSKTSTAFTDLEQTIDGLLENIEIGVRHLQQNQTNFKEQQDVTKKSIAAKRAEINKHLDLLEETLLEELKSKSEKTMKEMSLMTTKLETQRKNISDLKDTAQHMKQFSSNLQMFVGIRSILKTVVNEINGIKILVNSIPQLSIRINNNPKFDTFTEAFDSLGEIQITSKEAVVSYVERLLLQAQYQRPAEQLDNLQLKLRTNIKMGEMNSEVTSCLILPNKSIMIANGNKTLTILNEDGSHDRDIRVPNDPYDVTIIDDKRVAISYGADIPRISIVNINAHNANQTLKKMCKFGIHGITYNDGKLYAVTDGEGIKVIGLDGNIIQRIRIYDDGSNTGKVTTHNDKIYYSVDNGSVHCVDMEGTEIWTCQDDRLKSLASAAIAVDNYGLTFAAGFFSNLLLAISPDGKQQKVLLTSSDGLQKPNAVYYDKDSKRLLVCNYYNGHAALYDVIY